MVCLNEIFDPTTNRTVNGSVVRDPFLGNKIPTTRIDPTAAIIQNMIPLPNTPGLFNYTAPAYSNFRHTTIPSIKIDHNLSAKTKLAGYYSATKTFSPQTNGFPEPYTALQPQNPLAQTIRINLDTTLSPTLLLHIGAGYLHTSNPQTAPNVRPEGTVSPGSSLHCEQLLPLYGGHVQHHRGRMERWRLDSPASNTGVAFSLTPDANDYKPTFNTNLTWVKGNHTYKLGATALFEGIQSVNDSRADGQFAFSRPTDQRPLAKRPAFCEYREQRIRICQLLSRCHQQRVDGGARGCAARHRIPMEFISRTVGKSRVS